MEIFVKYNMDGGTMIGSAETVLIGGIIQMNIYIGEINFQEGSE